MSTFVIWGQQNLNQLHGILQQLPTSLELIHTWPQNYLVHLKGSLGCLYIELFGERKVWPGLNTAVEVVQKVCGSYNTAPTMPKTDDLPLLYAKLCNSCCQLNAKDHVNMDVVIEQPKILNLCKYNLICTIFNHFDHFCYSCNYSISSHKYK